MLPTANTTINAGWSLFYAKIYGKTNEVKEFDYRSNSDILHDDMLDCLHLISRAGAAQIYSGLCSFRNLEKMPHPNFYLEKNFILRLCGILGKSNFHKKQQ